MTSPKTRPDIGFIPTPDDAIAAMLKLAELTPADHVYDLGCGDGRLLIQAALDYGVTAVGIDVDADLLATARTKAEAAGVGQQLQFFRNDLFECAVNGCHRRLYLFIASSQHATAASPVTATYGPEPAIISHQFDMGELAPRPYPAARALRRKSLSYMYGESPKSFHQN